MSSSYVPSSSVPAQTRRRSRLVYQISHGSANNHIDQHAIHRRAEEAQMSLHIRTVSSEPSQLAIHKVWIYMKAHAKLQKHGLFNPYSADKNESENVVCCKYFLTHRVKQCGSRQKQSDLGLHCMYRMLLPHLGRRQKADDICCELFVHMDKYQR